MPAQMTYTSLNHLRKGAVYRAITATGITIGEYLGMEALYGERAVMLRNSTGTTSIFRRNIVSIERAA